MNEPAEAPMHHTPNLGSRIHVLSQFLQEHPRRFNPIITTNCNYIALFGENQQKC